MTHETADRLKSIDEFSDQSAGFEERFDELLDDPSAADQLNSLCSEIVSWLGACLEHGRYLAPATPERRALKGIVDYWRSTLRRHGREVTVTDELAPFDPTAGIPLEVECPYPGLDPYTSDLSTRFFGREALVDDCIEKLEDPGRRLVMVIGASGSGKSSLALGGVRPRLREKHCDDWAFAGWFTPGADPVRAMAQAILVAAQPGAGEAAVGAFAEKLAGKPGDALALCAEACGGKPLFIIIDQFEELFTLCRDATLRQRFADCLHALGAPGAVRGGFSCHMMLTLRTDQLARFELSEGLKPLHALLVGGDNDFNLAAIKSEDIRHAIARPAEEVGLRFVPPTLIDALASQTAGLANGLPLLQFALLRLWDTRIRDAEGRPLDFISKEMVDALPDVKGALGTVAESLYLDFSDAQKEICERMLLELVVLDETFEEPLRRRRGEAELIAALDKRFPGNQDAISEIIERFVGHHLLRRFGDAAAPRLEVAHEALLRHWSRINQYLLGAGIKERLHLIKLIGRDAAEWAVRGRQEANLNLGGERLDRAIELVDEGWLAEEETVEYVKASRALSARRGRQATSSRYALLGVLLMVLLALAGWGKVVMKNRDAEANNSTFASIASALPPWEALDLAHTMVKGGNKLAVLPLAHALERMANTWQLGKKRDTVAYLNPDGSAAYTLEYPEDDGKSPQDGGTRSQFTPSSVQVFLLDDAFSSPPRSVKLLEGARDAEERARLAEVVIGPRTEDDKHIVLLFLRAESGKGGQTLDAFLIDRKSERADKLRIDIPSDLRGALAVHAGRTPPSFSADGARAVFSMLSRGNGPDWKASRLVELSLVDGALSALDLTDPVPGAGPVVSVALQRGGTLDTPITLRADGKVFCGDMKVGEVDRPDERPLAWGALVSHPDASVAGIQYGNGLVSVVDCETQKTSPLSSMEGARLRGNAGSLNLAVLSADAAGSSGAGRPDVVLSFVEGDAMKCRRIRDADGKWYDCSSRHQISVGLLSPAGSLLVAERQGIAVLQRIANPGPPRAGKDEIFLADAAAGSLLRIRPLGEKAGEKGGEKDLGQLEWTGSDGQSHIAARSGRIITAAQSASGRHIAWLEAVDKAYVVKSCKLTTGEAACSHVPIDGALTNTEALAINDKGHVARFERGPLDSEGSRQGGKVYLGNRPLAQWEQDVIGHNSLRCMRFSANGRWLAVGLQRGLVRLRLEPPGQSPAPEILIDRLGQIDPRFPLKGVRYTDALSSCDIDDEGRVAVGFEGGDVWWFLDDDAIRLTSKVFHRLPAGAATVAFRKAAGRDLLVALGREQKTGCTRPGLPGQGLRVWDLDASGDRDTPVSDTCFPNQKLVAVGMVEARKDGLVELRLFDPGGKAWDHVCLGCREQGESPSQLSARLVAEAARHHAGILDPKVLGNYYGLQGYGD